MATTQQPRHLAQGEDAQPSTSASSSAAGPLAEQEQTKGEVEYEILPSGHRKYPKGRDPRLRYQKPYWWPYKTFVKHRWIGRELLEVVSTEFRDRSVEYYRHALESGVTRVNGVVASPSFVLRNGDRIDNTVHRHEPPITNDPILVLHKDDEREFVVISKPGSIPVHATGRYFRHTILEIMLADYGIKCFSVNRLDRLTSGLMILALTGPASRDLSMEFAEGQIRKEYVARVKGRFPDGRITVDKPLLTVDRQMGLVIVTPEGKEAKTIFKRLSYDAERDQSVVHCRPMTGRTHQIRVHLQYLGHPIANDPLYSHDSIWGSDLGRGGVDLVPDDKAVSAEETLKARVKDGREADGGRAADGGQEADRLAKRVAKVDLNDREYANIDAGSPIRLSQQARDIIAKLRRARDEQEDWVKWKEVVFTAKAAQDKLEAEAGEVQPTTTGQAAAQRAESSEAPDGGQAEIPKLHHARRLDAPDALPDTFQSSLARPAHLPPGFCDECFVPVAEDPDPETLFIFLHALRYTTPRLGAWATPLPRWAGERWEGDWRGWSDDPVPLPFPDEPAEGEEARVAE